MYYERRRAISPTPLEKNSEKKAIIFRISQTGEVKFHRSMLQMQSHILADNILVLEQSGYFAVLRIVVLFDMATKECISL